MSDNNMNGKDFLLGIVVGSALGAITALLLAPKSGRELRSDISDQYHTVSEKTQKIATEIGDKTQKIASELSDKTQKIASEVGEKSQELIGKAKEVVSTVSNEIKARKETHKEEPQEIEEQSS